MDELRDIFNENRKIHIKAIQEAETRRIDYWMKKIQENKEITKDLSCLYMMASGESNRVIKILINEVLKKWKRISEEQKNI